MTVEPRTALITGATGFVGAHVTRRLLAEGWRVHVVARPESSLALLGEAAPALTVHRHAGATEQLIDIVRQAQPQVVLHLAALFLARHTPADIEPLVRANVLFGAQLLEAMHLNQATRLVNAGTSWQHYENAAYNPVNLYAATKQAFEALAVYYQQAGGLKMITLSLFDTYGPGDPRPKLFYLLQQAARTGQPLVMSPGEQLIDLVHVADVARAFAQAASLLTQPECPPFAEYAVTSGQPLPLKELVSRYEAALGHPLPVTWGARPYRDREVMRPWHTGPRLPGWHAIVPLEAGLAEIITSSLEIHP